MQDPGISLVVNGRALRLRAIALSDRHGDALPRWIVDVDGIQGTAHTLESAIILAARGAARQSDAE